MDNVSRVKQQLRQFNKNEDDAKCLKVLIADDVLVNVKILNSMLSHDPDAIKNHMNLYDYHLSKPFSKVAIETIVNKIKDDRLRHEIA